MTDRGKRNSIIIAVVAGILGVLVAAGFIAPEVAETLLDAVGQFTSPETAKPTE